MRTFVLHVLAFFAIQALILAVVVGVYRVDRNGYAAGFVLKHERLDSAPGARLILVGGSNVCFSTDSELLKRRLGLEPVDLALQHSLGLRFMLREAENGMRRGDVIVLSLEYGQYGERTEEPLSLFGVIEQDSRALEAIDLDWPLFKLFADRSHLYARSVLRSVANDWMRRDGGSSPPYTRDSMNRYGDVVAHWSMPTRGFGVQQQTEASLDAEARERLHDFAKTCEARGVRLFVYHPVVPRRKFEGMKLDAFQHVLDRELGIPQLNRLSEVSYPDELFFDTVYHLTRAGTERRTADLADRLERALTGSPARR
jgi:hypothetical protein